MFVNLLKNAREALEAGGDSIAAPAIEVDCRQGGGTVVLSVADNGPGLPPRARQHLFVAFQGSAKSGGTGLGLAIAHELVEAHGGQLSIEEQPVGTRFDITLPATSPLA